jgi:serine/threonine protein phosphatase PrpC
VLRVAQSTYRTDTGRQRRENEDSAFVRAPLFVIADGMGGAQAGEVASQLAVEAFQGELPDEGTPEQRLAGRARDANRRIYEISRSEHERAGMGTTLTALYVDETNLAVAHVGDSRAYLFREGQLGRLTQDHTLVEELVRRGKLTQEQAAEHPQRSIITRALGVDPEVDVDTWTYTARAGDIVLMCSDGLTSMISEERITAVLESEHDLDRAADRLITEANEAGGRDNITVILARLEEVEDGHVDDQPTMVGMAEGASPGDGRTAAGAAAGAAVGTSAATATAARADRQTATPATPPRPAPRTPRTHTQRTRPIDGSRGPRRPQRFAKPLAALISLVIVLCLIGGGGYLATRTLFFVGTNPQGILTVYRGLPYDLPLGIHLYETFYVSGAPADLVPAGRRSQLLDHQLRSQNSAIALVRDAELGQLTR